MFAQHRGSRDDGRTGLSEQPPRARGAVSATRGLACFRALAEMRIAVPKLPLRAIYDCAPFGYLRFGRRGVFPLQ
jgi:hypothetical protein